MVEVFMSGQGKANGKRENSSITVSKWQLVVHDGKGPLKSILSLSKGCEGFIECDFPSCAAFLAAGCIIDESASYAADAVPLSQYTGAHFTDLGSMTTG